MNWDIMNLAGEIWAIHDKRDTGIDKRIDELVQSVSASGLHLIRMFPADLVLFFPYVKEG